MLCAMRNEKENENENNESDDDAFLAKMHLFKKFPIASQSFFIRDSNTRITVLIAFSLIYVKVVKSAATKLLATPRQNSDF